MPDPLGFNGLSGMPDLGILEKEIDISYFLTDEQMEGFTKEELIKLSEGNSNCMILQLNQINAPMPWFTISKEDCFIDDIRITLGNL